MLNRCLITSEYHSNKLERISKFVTRPNGKPSYHLFIVFAEVEASWRSRKYLGWRRFRRSRQMNWAQVIQVQMLEYLFEQQEASVLTNLVPAQKLHELNNTSDSLIRLSEKSVRVTSYSNFINTSVSIFWARFSKLWFLGYWRVVPSIVGLFWAAVFLNLQMKYCFSIRLIWFLSLVQTKLTPANA